MAFESITDKKIEELLKCPKQIKNPTTRKSTKAGHEQFNYSVEATDGSENTFVVYKRQNLAEGMEDDFSCGICWIVPNGETLTLKRYNGPSHNHPNKIENEKLGYNCHIHMATEKYIRANLKPEGFAIITQNYYTLNGAFYWLVKECNITGIATTPDPPKLF
ncbi:MAG: hypothetical protein EPN37_12960 [Chitinophagaceae bacterium]|nr:MAG: hypothetical protein EPN37_12960 [Chitinophagaceae bacterium]